VKCVVRVDGVEQAIACANDNEYGLSAAVFGRDIAARQRGAAHRLGHLPRERPTVHDEAQMPFGGVKGSGSGASAAARASRVHGPALDHGTVDAAALPVLSGAGARGRPASPE
jgi:acyl-CoA reductase-like NAD-dependent aldehyde dehydrogenase